MNIAHARPGTGRRSAAWTGAFVLGLISLAPLPGCKEKKDGSAPTPSAPTAPSPQPTQSSESAKFPQGSALAQREAVVGALRSMSNAIVRLDDPPSPEEPNFIRALRAIKIITTEYPALSRFLIDTPDEVTLPEAAASAAKLYLDAQSAHDFLGPLEPLSRVLKAFDGTVSTVQAFRDPSQLRELRSALTAAREHWRRELDNFLTANSMAPFSPGMSLEDTAIRRIAASKMHDWPCRIVTYDSPKTLLADGKPLLDVPADPQILFKFVAELVPAQIRLGEELKYGKISATLRVGGTAAKSDNTEGTLIQLDFFWTPESAPTGTKDAAPPQPVAIGRYILGLQPNTESLDRFRGEVLLSNTNFVVSTNDAEGKKTTAYSTAALQIPDPWTLDAKDAAALRTSLLNWWNFGAATGAAKDPRPLTLGTAFSRWAQPVDTGGAAAIIAAEVSRRTGEQESRLVALFLSQDPKTLRAGEALEILASVAQNVGAPLEVAHGQGSPFPSVDGRGRGLGAILTRPSTARGFSTFAVLFGAVDLRASQAEREIDLAIEGASSKPTAPGNDSVTVLAAASTQLRALADKVSAPFAGVDQVDGPTVRAHAHDLAVIGQALWSGKIGLYDPAHAAVSALYRSPTTRPDLLIGSEVRRDLDERWSSGAPLTVDLVDATQCGLKRAYVPVQALRHLLSPDIQTLVTLGRARVRLVNMGTLTSDKLEPLAQWSKDLTIDLVATPPAPLASTPDKLELRYSSKMQQQIDAAVANQNGRTLPPGLPTENYHVVLQFCGKSPLAGSAINLGEVPLRIPAVDPTRLRAVLNGTLTPAAIAQFRERARTEGRANQPNLLVPWNSIAETVSAASDAPTGNVVVLDGILQPSRLIEQAGALFDRCQVDLNVKLPPAEVAAVLQEELNAAARQALNALRASDSSANESSTIEPRDTRAPNKPTR